MLFGRFFKKLFTRNTPAKDTGDRGESAAARFLKKTRNEDSSPKL